MLFLRPYDRGGNRLTRAASGNFLGLPCPGMALPVLQSRCVLLQNSAFKHYAHCLLFQKTLLIWSLQRELLGKEYKTLFMDSKLLALFRSLNILMVQMKFKYQLIILMLIALNNSLIRYSFSDTIIHLIRLI